MKNIWLYLLAVMFLVTSLIWLSAFQNTSSILRLVTCDVGQGDAILITYKSQQILVDGGPGSKVLECLANNVPFWDREIELVFLTHSEKDHYGGLIDVFRSYDVKNFVTSGVISGSQDYEVLANEVGGGQTKVSIVDEGSIIRYSLMSFEVLWPSEQFINSNTARINAGSANVLGTYTTTKSKNDFSLVTLFRFGNFDALLTGDIEDDVSDQIAEKLKGKNLNSVEYIKIPHHGSKNGISEKLAQFSMPEIAVISAGKNNSYGHPHKDVLKILRDNNIKILRTDLTGDVVIESDGKTYWIKKEIDYANFLRSIFRNI